MSSTGRSAGKKRRKNRLMNFLKIKRKKFGNKKTVAKGKVFDSGLEATRFELLTYLESVGEIQSLKLQVKFELIPAQYANGKCVERACSYYADFTYFKNGEFVVEDTKSEATRKEPSYIMKRKLMLLNHGIRIVEVMSG